MKRTRRNALTDWITGAPWRFTTWRAARRQNAARARQQRERGRL